MSAMPLSLVAARIRRGTGLLSLVASGVMLGTGGPIGRLLGQETGLSPVAVAGYRLAAGGALILVVLAVTSSRPPRGRVAWTRVGVVGTLAAGYQVCFLRLGVGDLGQPGDPRHRRRHAGTRVDPGVGDRPSPARPRRPVPDGPRVWWGSACWWANRRAARARRRPSRGRGSRSRPPPGSRSSATSPRDRCRASATWPPPASGSPWAGCSCCRSRG